MNYNYVTLRETLSDMRGFYLFLIFIIFITILDFLFVFLYLNDISIPDYVGMLLRQCILTNHIELYVGRQIFICMINTFFRLLLSVIYTSYVIVMRISNH